ncbi:MAG TPA: hypothetical protein VGM91_02875 [Conexibacter sp.]
MTAERQAPAGGWRSARATAVSPTGGLRLRGALPITWHAGHHDPSTRGTPVVIKR